MLLENKKEHVLRCVKLGMELYKSFFIAECTAEEIDLLTNDDSFKYLVEQQYALEEYELLIEHGKALKVASAKGQANAIQWKLSRLNKERWDSSNDKAPVDETPMEPITVILKGKGPESIDD